MQAVAHFVETFVPEHYEVFLDLSRKTKTFSGRVVITGQAKADKISLHQKDLTIETVEVAGQARPFTVENQVPVYPQQVKHGRHQQNPRRYSQ